MQMGWGHEVPSPSTVESAGIEPARQALQRPALAHQTPLRLLQMALLEHQALRACYGVPG